MFVYVSMNKTNNLPTKMNKVFLSLILLISANLLKSQSPNESIKVIQAVINFDNSVSEKNIVVCELLQEYNDSVYIGLMQDNYGGVYKEDIKYLKFGDLNVRLVRQSGLIVLDKISHKLNKCDSITEALSESNYQQLVYEIFDRDLCTFNQVLFSRDKSVAIVKYSVETGSNLGYGDFSMIYLLEKKNTRWIVKDLLEGEI